MKRKLLVAFAALTLGIATQSQAAFVVKKTPVKTEQTANADKETVGAAEESAAAVATVVTETKVVKKHSFFYHLLHRPAKGDVIPLGLYIIMAILPLGWLAMGLNDNFTGYPWILSLILYILGYVPGIICTLLFIPRYY